MADIQLDEQSSPSTPASGKQVLYVDSTNSAFLQKADSGRIEGDSSRALVSSVTANAANTYITSSGLLLPSSGMQVGMCFVWKVAVSKTAAGTAAATGAVVIGTNQTTADTARLSLAHPVQTAAAKVAIAEIMVTVRSVSATGTMQGTAAFTDVGLTGFTTLASGVEGISAGFDNSNLGGQYVSLTVNPNTAGVWTISQCLGRIYY